MQAIVGQLGEEGAIVPVDLLPPLSPGCFL